MCFTQEMREFVRDCLTRRGRCLVAFDQLGYHHTTMYLNKVSLADIVIRDDGCFWGLPYYVSRQLLYDGMHVRSSALPLYRKKWVYLMDSKIMIDALKIHWRYMCKIYQYAPYFSEARSVFERVYISDNLSFRDFCVHFLSLCAWSLGLHVMHVPISQILASLPFNDGFWLWISSISYRRHRELWKHAFIYAFQNLIWDVLFPKIRILRPKTPRSGLYQQALSHRSIVEEIQALLSKRIDVVAYDIAQSVYPQHRSIPCPFVPHLWLLDFFFNCGFSWYSIYSGSVASIAVTNIY